MGRRPTTLMCLSFKMLEQWSFTGQARGEIFGANGALLGDKYLFIKAFSSLRRTA